MRAVHYAMQKRLPAANPSAWQSAIREYIVAHPSRPIKPRDLAAEFAIAPQDYPAFRATIREMLGSGLLALGRGRRLLVPGVAATLTGVFRATRQGYAFLEVGRPPDIFIPAHAIGDARDGDTVQVRIRESHKRPDEVTAEVLRVLERATVRWVGVLERTGERWRVRLRGKNAPFHVEVPDTPGDTVRAGDWVVVEPIEGRWNAAHPRGVIVKRLGPATQIESLIRAVLHQFGIVEHFSEEVLREARSATQQFNPDRSEDREDLCDLLTFTIDPIQARDFDDAISIEELPGGKIRLGVHVADVAHFVPEGGALDREAQQRGTSVYFPGFVVPMLPEVLSNGVCSLQPGEPRLTRSVFLTYDAHAAVVESRIVESRIRSYARLTYEQASAALLGEPHAIDLAVMHALRLAESLARRIRHRRLRNGMIALNLPEVEIRLDDAGRPRDAGPADASFSHTIIEMFMVEANEAVSAFLHGHGVTHLRRVHPLPVTDPGVSLRQLTTLLGSRPPRVLSRDYVQSVLARVAGRPEESAACYVLLRALSQAFYSPIAQEHFALASEHYCHFTSPIRRYPDLTVHRLVHDVLRAGRQPRRRRREEGQADHESLLALGRHCSAMERRAQAANRDAVQTLLIEILRDQIGKTFDAVITNVLSYGAFVQIRPYLAEGLVPVEKFGGDDWEYEEQRAIFVGRRTRRIIALGQVVRVRLVELDAIRNEIRFEPDERRPFGIHTAAPRDAAAQDKRRAQRRSRRRPHSR